MNDLQLFNNPEFGAVRAVEVDGEPWFVGKDVAQALGYNDTDQALRKHVDDEDKLTRRFDWSGQGRSMTTINESGLYSLVLSSKLPGAKKFKRWVTAEVLPTIRKTGGYQLPKDYPSALRALADATEKLLAVETENEANRPKVLFADAVSTAKTSILVGELAKLLKQNGVDIGQNRLFGWLRENGFLIRRNGTDFNMPTQKSMNLGLFEIKETVVSHADGHTSVNKTPKVTGKGQQYFVQRFLGGTS
ncbi:phage antirepressor KilAC domain-containing protein [Flavonifractor sp. An4]|uniref:phage antirepressor KilAC domain-containing protein n=1 Tax=Flavonifractor sp. An4 TaxID=1965634 RepID=UPI000B37AF30|nr:phage antirepressor KilAC domain-containing protein [Flavonifractor sp. An4]OUO09179.1 phage repressor protein/antirepressor Ant [Flavonifractor sp. An4]